MIGGDLKLSAYKSSHSINEALTNSAPRFGNTVFRFYSVEESDGHEQQISND
jgi:hypothetical protein